MRKIIVALSSVLILILASHPARAQENGLAVYIARPGEGETFYSGPTSFLYRTQVSGWVTGYGSNPGEVEVRLEIFQNDLLLGSQLTQLQSRGTFNFYVTINPDSPQEIFPPELATCAYTCHTPSKLGLPAGEMLMRVTVSLPDGRQAIDERQVAVDRAEYLTIPVEVIHAEDPDLITTGIPVKASTWLYMWRARLFSGATNLQGQASVNIEALSRAPARYLFQVEPVIVDGVFYQSTEAVEVILPPGTRTPPKITLTVTSQTGRISGALIQDGQAFHKVIPIIAVRLPDGASFRTTSTENGTFEFGDLPISRYAVIIDNTALILEDRHAQTQEIDLSQDIHASLNLPITFIPNPLQGAVSNDEGNPLPFAWITQETSGQTQFVWPIDGSFTLYGLDPQPGQWIVSAPGYYSQVLQADPAEDAVSGREIRLARQPDTQILTWGNGDLTLPAESQIQINENSLYVERGWVWGRSGDSRALTIQAGTTVISLQDTKFALEVLPYQRQWLFIFEGQAQLHAPNIPDTITVLAGEMINLDGGLMRSAVSYDPDVLAALRPDTGSPLAPIWKPTLWDRILSLLARIGIGSIQVITASTYVLGILSIIIAPVAAIYYWRRRERRSKNPSHKKFKGPS